MWMVQIFKNEALTNLKLDEDNRTIYSDDPNGWAANELMEQVKIETREFGIVGVQPQTGLNILSDPWSFFLWLSALKLEPEWVGKPPKVLDVPKKAIA